MYRSQPATVIDGTMLEQALARLEAVSAELIDSGGSGAFAALPAAAAATTATSVSAVAVADRPPPVQHSARVDAAEGPVQRPVMVDAAEAPLVPTQAYALLGRGQQAPATRRRSRRSPEFQAAMTDMVALNARINKLVQFCNTVIVENRNAPTARDLLEQRSLTCAS